MQDDAEDDGDEERKQDVISSRCTCNVRKVVVQEKHLFRDHQRLIMSHVATKVHQCPSNVSKLRNKKETVLLKKYGLVARNKSISCFDLRILSEY